MPDRRTVFLFRTGPASPPKCSATACCRNSRSFEFPSRARSRSSTRRKRSTRSCADQRDRRARRPPPAGVQLDRRRGDERDTARDAPTRWCSTCSRSSSRRWRPSSAPSRRMRPGARTASPTATSISRAWRRSTSRRRTTTAPTTRDLAKAQVILVGVSRCGKTPTVALSRAAVRHPRGEFSADARRFRRQASCRRRCCRTATSCSA